MNKFITAVHYDIICDHFALQDVLDLDMNISSEQDEIVTKEKKASLRLQKSIARFIAKMDKIVAELEEKKDNEGVIWLTLLI